MYKKTTLSVAIPCKNVITIKKDIKMKKELLISVLAASLLTMTGCGSSSDDSGATSGGTTTTLSAQFIDSAVKGLNYDCQSSGKSGRS